MTTAETMLLYAVTAAHKSTCAKSRRGVVAWRPDKAFQGAVTGWNGPPTPFVCDGSKACRAACGRVAVHAEQAVLLRAGPEFMRNAEVMHVKVDAEGDPVPSGPPSCVECSKLLVWVGLAGVWLLHADGLRRYTSVEFHHATLTGLGLPSVGSGADR